MLLLIRDAEEKGGRIISFVWVACWKERARVGGKHCGGRWWLLGAQALRVSG